MTVRFRGTGITPSDKTGLLQATKAKGKTEFGGVLSSLASSKGLQSGKVSELMHNLQILAEQMKQSQVTKEQASRHFVGMIIKQQTHLVPHVKNIKKMEAAVAEVIEQDPFFLSKLETQLKKMGSAG